MPFRFRPCDETDSKVHAEQNESGTALCGREISTGAVGQLDGMCEECAAKLNELMAE